MFLQQVLNGLTMGSIYALLAVGVSFIFKNLSIVIWGAEKHVFPQLFNNTPINVNGLFILPQNIAIIAIALLFVVLLQQFFSKTKMGKCMRAAASDAEEKEALIVIVRRIQKDFDLTVLLVEHDMELVMNISEDITVLNYGQKIAQGSPSEVQSDETVIEAYLGRKRKDA